MAVMRRRSTVAPAERKAAQLARQDVTRRRRQWLRAAAATEAAGFPLTVAITVTWSACIAADPLPGHALGLPEEARSARLWGGLRRLAKRHGVQAFLAARAPEYDSQKGAHLHLMVHLPDAALRELVTLIERITGARAENMNMPDGVSMKIGGKLRHGVLARGALGAWMIQRNIRAGDGGTEGFIDYMSKQPRSEKVRTQHRLSGDLLALIGSAA